MAALRWNVVCVLLAILLVAAAGCSTRLADLTIISTKNVSLDKVDIDACPQKRNVEGEDSAFIFLFIPFGFPHLEDAIDDALKKGGGDTLVDGVLYRDGWWFLVGESTLRVEGTVVDTRGRQ